jgi:hypothetical protein
VWKHCPIRSTVFRIDALLLVNVKCNKTRDSSCHPPMTYYPVNSRRQHATTRTSALGRQQAWFHSHSYILRAVFHSHSYICRSFSDRSS